PVGATCTRAAVLEGHTIAVTVATTRSCSPSAAAEAMRAFRPDYAGLDLPSAPAHAIIVHDDPFRPQPRLDRDAEGGMATSAGRPARRARRPARRPEAHERLVPVAGPAADRERLGEPPEAGVMPGRSARSPDAERTRQDPSGVGVERRHVRPERDAGHRPGRI